MNVKQARQLVDDGLRADGHGRTSGSEWDAVLADQSLLARFDFSETPEEDLAADAVPFILGLRHAAGDPRRQGRYRTTTARADPQSPPDWWEAESQRRLYALREERVSLRLSAGLLDQHPLGSVAEIEPLVGRMVQRQLEWFFALHPLAEDLDPEGVADFQYEHEADWDTMEYPRETWEETGDYDLVIFPSTGLAVSREMPNDLDQLHRRSMRVAKNLRITQAECLVWSLTDFPFTIPWMPLLGENHWAPDGTWSTVIIHVNSVSATAQTVAKAYTDFRADSWGRVMDDGQKTAQRAPRPWPALVVAFVRQREKDAPRQPWEDRFTAFKDAHPNQPYKNVRTFAEAYRMKARRAKP